MEKAQGVIRKNFLGPSIYSHEFPDLKNQDLFLTEEIENIRL